MALALGLASACVAGAARADIGASVTLQSDYRYRGFSLTDGRPALAATVSYDHASGLYAGLTGVGVLTSHDGPQVAGYLADLGYARRLTSDVSLDLGVDHSALHLYAAPRYSVRYTEVYGGLSWRDLSTHLYYTRNYLGDVGAALYGEVDGSLHPTTRLRLFAHAGVFAPVGHGGGRREARYDLSAGAATTFKKLELRLALSEFGPNAAYLGPHPQQRAAVVISSTYAF